MKAMVKADLHESVRELGVRSRTVSNHSKDADEENKLDKWVQHELN